ncbi:hypothetical protein BDP55DRAFT_112408 [Colletotrichum godetiae]|uniref:Secreted protein n=1 Tax=Colletotrichum godetiae TaxID=1209918 RepID=A0AAJ0ALU9_9PEZI|nr:uncharacterized protein BDP55DRAFT_112408 [Colletotrichum godetiae]KAK1676286.1 hypothetical protein BDP55DRAFT_112408 [Colletotrichum godetiae]
MMYSGSSLVILVLKSFSLHHTKGATCGRPTLRQTFLAPRPSNKWKWRRLLWRWSNQRRCFGASQSRRSGFVEIFRVIGTDMFGPGL